MLARAVEALGGAEAKNPMGEVVMATPAISADTLIVRTQRHIFGLSDRVSAKPQS